MHRCLSRHVICTHKKQETPTDFQVQIFVSMYCFTTYREGKKFTYSGSISESFMFLKFILSLSLVLTLSPYLLYINFLFSAVISCSYGCFHNKKVACPTFCSVYIRRYIVIHCIIMIEQVFICPF